ncbi:MAG: glucosamine-6-phosphate deaminase [Eubacteriales bacterium]|nr:glucosamine-6-phosphate deaminase [Eubacteriales bacterium]MDD4422588.1 glucosamine-6-phosphate deaminase [Eubacteriales bacterium]HBR31361.1 glucosamine-6-phosphate deaminase [Clostridiales bacterium]
MKIVIETKENIAKLAAQQYAQLLKRKPNAVLGCATGSTPLGLYTELAHLNKEGKITFKDVTTFNLDEYVGLEPTHDQSYRYFMNQNLFNHIDVRKERTFVPSGLITNNETAAQYDKDIEAAGGIDLQLLGIGCNGHIGFNEPGTPFGSVTHVVELTQNTREVNSRFFSSIDEVPTKAVTMGIKTVMNARSIILIALGASKAQIIRDTIKGEITPNVPASVLQLHPDVTIYVDKEAAELI